MLDACHGITLHAAHRRSPHACQMLGVLSVALLRTAPGWMARKIDADAGKEIAAQRAHLAADGLADPFFQMDIEGCAASHGNGEGGGAAHHHTTGSIEELQSFNSEALYDARIPGVGSVASDHHVGNAGVECVRPG